MGIQYQPLTESFRELNRMLIEKQAWDADFKLREADRGIKNMMTQAQLTGMQQQQEMAAYQLKEKQRMHTPQTFQMSKFPVFQGNPDFMEEFESNPEAMEQFRKLIDDKDVGYKYSPADKTWRHPISNEPYQMTPYESQFRVPGMQGVIDGTVDTVASMQRTQSELTSQIGALDKDIDKARKGQYSKQAVQELMKKRQGYVNDLKKANDFLSPEGLLKFYENKQGLMIKRANFYRSLGAGELAEKNADNAARSKQVILDKILSAKTDKSGKATGEVKLFAIKPLTYKGKKYDIGSTRLERWNADETEKQYDPEYWSTEDPLAEDKRRGTGADKNPVFGTDKMINSFADDAKSTGFMGQMTEAHAERLRDDLGAAARRLGELAKLGPRDDRYQVYETVKQKFAEARDVYFNRLDIAQLPDKELKELKAQLAQKKQSIGLMSLKEFRKTLKEEAEGKFKDQIKLYTGKKIVRWLPNKQKDIQVQSVQ
jgi:hypothetical protein